MSERWSQSHNSFGTWLTKQTATADSSSPDNHRKWRYVRRPDKPEPQQGVPDFACFSHPEMISRASLEVCAVTILSCSRAFCSSVLGFGSWVDNAATSTSKHSLSLSLSPPRRVLLGRLFCSHNPPIHKRQAVSTYNLPESIRFYHEALRPFLHHVDHHARPGCSGCHRQTSPYTPQ